MKLTPQARNETASATIAQTLLVMLGISMLCIVTVYAADPPSWNDPVWWYLPGTGTQPAVMSPEVVTNEGVVSTNYITNENAVVTQGQLKQFTARAVDELNANLSGGAGDDLNNLVQGWAQDYATNLYFGNSFKPSDYTAMNVGQLKQVGNMVWSQLVAQGYTNAMPSWLATTNAGDYSAANIGQLKEVFNFDFAGGLDPDGSGLPIGWELEYFGQTGLYAYSSPDGYAYLLEDYQDGLNPTNYFNQLVDGEPGIVTPGITAISGNNQVSTPGNYTAMPLVVQVTNSSGGAPLVNAPVTFTVTSGGGQVAGTTPATQGSSFSTTTDSNGDAQAFYQQPATSGVTSTITATTASHSTTFSESTSAGDGTFDAPSDVVASRASETEIDLSWVNNASTATSIIIRQSTDNDATWTVVATLSDPTVTSYAATNLTPGLVYDFGVSGAK